MRTSEQPVCRLTLVQGGGRTVSANIPFPGREQKDSSSGHRLNYSDLVVGLYWSSTQNKCVSKGMDRRNIWMMTVLVKIESAEWFWLKINCQPVGNLFLCGSQLTIIVPGCVMECGKRSEGKTPRNIFTSHRVHRICNVSIIIISSIQ